MDKKKILSVLIISLIVLGSVLFVVKNLNADGGYSDEFIKCEKYCWAKAKEGYSYEKCIILYCIPKL